MEIGKSTPTPAVPKRRLFLLLQSVYYSLRRILSKHNLRFLLERGRVAGRSISRQLTYRCTDHGMSFYGPRGAVEFSCSNTPTSSYSARRRNHFGYQSVTAVERTFEILDSGEGLGTPTPSPSPSPIKSPAGEKRVDKEAEEFIRRFYEQLRSQQRVNMPELGFGR